MKDNERLVARVVGLIYLAGFAVGLTGSPLLTSAAPLAVASGAVLWLLAAVGDAAHGVLLFPVLWNRAPRSAVGYLAARVADALLVSLMALFALVPELKAAGTQAYNFGMIALAVSGLVLNAALTRTKLLPLWLTVWGLIGYATLLIGMTSELFGSGLGLLSTVPGGLWEVFAGVWLIAKGFRTVPTTRA
jgi:hypothetical protein